MYTIRKKFRFEFAHQLDAAFSKCCSETIHGHSYVLECFFSSRFLDETGMVIDFGEVKEKMKELLEEYDHALIMPNTFSADYLSCLNNWNSKLKIVSYNPTAEKMAEDLYFKIKKILPLIKKVRLHETETGFAEFEQGE
jgi:6-pyruvoyltetrahydropterin/6-carboxytetrahydropterin synthase